MFAESEIPARDVALSSSEPFVSRAMQDIPSSSQPSTASTPPSLDCGESTVPSDAEDEDALVSPRSSQNAFQPINSQETEIVANSYLSLQESPDLSALSHGKPRMQEFLLCDSSSSMVISDSQPLLSQQQINLSSLSGRRYTPLSSEAGSIKSLKRHSNNSRANQSSTIFKEDDGQETESDGDEGSENDWEKTHKARAKRVKVGMPPHVQKRGVPKKRVAKV